MRDRPEILDEIRVIDAVGPSTIQPLAVSKRFDRDFRESVRSVLVDFHRTEAGRQILEHGLIDRWVPVDAADYDDIREMLEVCEAAGFMEIR
jgi:ABC-type phosphate/phosphonate transport system substrate-binding protein